MPPPSRRVPANSATAVRDRVRFPAADFLNFCIYQVPQIVLPHMWQVEPPSHLREGPLMVQCGVNLASFLFPQPMKYLVIKPDSGSAPYVNQRLIIFTLGITSFNCRSKSSRQV